MRGLHLGFTPHAVEFISDEGNQQEQKDYAAEPAALALRAQTGIGPGLIGRARTPGLPFRAA